MRKPAFFIIGAPKCGTTSMDIWLSEHPAIYMAKKEPHYFNTDHKKRKTTDLNAYQALFAAATDAHVVLGETSVRYLYSQDAVANILDYNINAKLIVMLRNPIDMVYSFHSQMYFSGSENVRDFTTAWYLQDRRLLGQCIQHCDHEPKMLQYGAVCRLGVQLQRLYGQLSSDRVHLIFFEDLVQNAPQTYQRVLQFLGVADNHKQNFNIHNPAKTPRFHSLRGAPHQLGRIKAKLGITSNFGIAEFIRTKNKKNQNRKPLSHDMRCTLIDYFSDDIALLARLTNRDLSHWLR